MKTLLQIAPSVFSKHELAVKHADSLERNGNYNLLAFVLIFVCCALVIYIYLRFYKKTLLVFSSVISYNASQQIQREGHSFIKSFSFFLFLIYMICGGIFFTDLSIYEGWFRNTSTDVVRLLVIASIGLLIVCRRFLNQALGSVVKEKNAAEDLFFQYAFGAYIGALIMLICCFLLHYSNVPPAYLFSLGVSLLGLLYVVRIIKTLVFGYSMYGFSLFHLVLYLCAVEIIPLAVFVKVIVNS
ncbi:MAG TPA: DUF4271 domain-containing protein [Bacteroidia bacterium]|nr:DUF4271 domain-containing protein [Bacteroidia bacterium]